MMFLSMELEKIFDYQIFMVITSKTKMWKICFHKSKQNIICPLKLCNYCKKKNICRVILNPSDGN